MAPQAQHIPCTCRELPKLVDFDSTDARESLMNNLSRFGWSQIRTKVTTNEKSQPPEPTQEQILEYFNGSPTSSHRPQPANCVYRSLESGAIGTVEPKESLEVKIADVSPDNHHSSSNGRPRQGPEPILQWCRSLRSIAERVNQLLELPPNVLLESPREKSLDLMRAFYYHAVPEDNTLSLSSAPAGGGSMFGSSEHTDWGTLTVVWQDQVGGLQTFCQACQKYVDVPTVEVTSKDHGGGGGGGGGAPSNDKSPNEWSCIVHVGDTLSLALGRRSTSVETSYDSADSKDQPKHGEVRWPSPTHRVLAQSKVRTSLVYFVYPPSTSSIQSLQMKLRGWEESRRGLQLPLSMYYLLKDQSTEGSETPSELFESMVNRSLGEVFQEKWGQVQR